MTLPTATEITNAYLYKNKLTPKAEERVDSIQILEKDSESFEVNKSEFMDSQTGPGRFVTAADFRTIHLFFAPILNHLRLQTPRSLENLKPGEYTKTQIFQKLGYIDKNGKSVGRASVTQTLAFYDDGQDDLLERAYIWNTTAFKITDEAIFVVEENGNRYIKNFAIEPVKEENFDFKGGFWSNLANLTLEPQIDPSGVGKKVIIEFIGEVEKKAKFTKADFLAEKERKNHFSILNGAEVGLKLNKLIEKLWNNGSIKHLYKEKPIIYGSAQDDKLDGFVTLAGVDISGFNEMANTGNFYVLERYLMDYVKNGITYVTGKGNDEIKGTQYNDIFYAGEGSDLLEGGEGHDIYYVTNGDIIIDSDGNGEIRFQDKESNYFTGDEQVGYFGRITGIRGHNAKFIGNDSNGIAYAYVLNGLSFDGKNFSAASLVMTNLETEHQITIRNFKNGHLNIYLNDLIYFDREIHAISYYFDTSENLFNTYDVDPHSGWARLKHGGDRNDASDLDANGGDTSNHGSSNTRRESAGRGSPNQGKRKLQLYDPLVLDLDGDGIETVGHNGHSGSLFDHDADGIRTSTGWIKGDDGLLVLDKDGDGKITNASELFSDMVILSDSTRAQHGFSALKDLDSNDDGVIDKQDTKFSELKLWRDLNQNGISEENELFNLSDFAIKSLHTAYEDRYDEVAGDNILSQLGKYEKEDGSFGAMADINFSFNPFYSDFAEKLKLTEEQERIINLRGIGRVRDLREAATLSTELNVLLQQYTIAKTREEQHALLPTILQKWAQTDNKYQSYSLHLEKTVEDSSPDAQVIRLTPSQLSALRNAQHDPAVMQRFEDNKSKISTINSLYSMNIAQLYYTTDEDIDYITDKINRIYNNLIQLAYESLLLQTRLKKYVDSVGFLYKDGVLSRDYSYTVQLFNETFAESPSNALTDLSEYIVLLKNPREWYEGLLLLNQYFEAVEKEGLIEDWKANSSTILNKLERKRIFFSKGFSLNDDQGNDKFLSNITNNVNDRTGNDIFFGSLNDDRLYGGEGDDHLYGGLGDDRLYGGEGEDYLEGGVGQDILEGGQGSDTYVFSKGHGQDILKDEANYGARDIDRLIFTDVALNEVKFRQEGEDLVLFGYHKEDSLRLKYFYSDARYKLEHITFADQSFDLASLRQVTLPLFGSAEDDTINDWSGNSRIEAGAGNDVVRGNDGNDILLGGLGDDRLYGGEGEDYLEGGVGQDILEGGQGSDTYVFSKGHGQDILKDEANYGARDIDRLIFTDVALNEVKFRQEGEDLVLFGYHKEDSLRLKYFYSDARYKLEHITFADQSFDLASLRQVTLPLFGSAEDDTINDWSGNSRIEAGAGNDVVRGNDGNDILLGGLGDDRLYGGEGEDYLEGGVGQDILEGGQGSDTYVFSKGHGQDILKDEANYGARDIDRLIFTDVALNEVKFRQEGEDLVLFGYHKEDSLRLKYFYSDARYKLEHITFADQSFDLASLRQVTLPLFGSAEDDTINDWSGNSRIEAGAGNDVVRGNDGNDILLGGLGDDRLYGGEGEDYLEGGVGQDILEGGQGSDTYVFSKGHGQDILKDEANYGARDIDRLIFTDVALNEVKFRQEGEDLVLFGYHKEDSLRLKYFYSDARYKLEHITFADQSFDLASLRQVTLPLFGSAEDDTINDWSGNSRIEAGAGNDVVRGNDGNDILLGGLGDDRLYGGEGEDYLEGGVGQDILEGGQGSDTYVFSKGHGQDILKDEANYGARDIDRLIFTDVALNEVKFRQEGEDLVLFGYHKEDSLRLKYFYSDARYKLEHITFADQSFDLASLRQVTLPLFGSAEDDTINDWSGNSRIEAGAGNDVVRGNDGNDILLGGLGDDRLYGGEGEDYLEGGVGQDILEGGQGSDTYVFSRGHGQDIIEDYSFNHFDSDIIRFVDVNIPEKLWFSRRDNNLLITNLDTADTLTVNNWYLSQNYQIERIELSDGRSLGSSQVEKLVSAMAEFDVEHSGDVLSVPQDEMRKYLNTLSVATYYS